MEPPGQDRKTARIGRLAAHDLSTGETALPIALFIKEDTLAYSSVEVYWALCEEM